MNPTQVKVQRNLAGLEFLLSRPDTREMLPQSKELDKCETYPAFYVCRAVMRDNLTVICISLRVLVTTFDGENETYTTLDIHGRGTTFEMALFDLSAKLIKYVGDNDIIDTEHLTIIEEGRTHERKNTDAGVCPDDSNTGKYDIGTSQQDVTERMAARSDGPSRGGANEKRHSKRRG